MTTLVDLTGNAQGSSTTGDMLGFVAPGEAPEVLGLSMYDFIYLVIRQVDQKQGALFLKRFLAGPQQVWATIVTKAQGIPDIWDYEETTDDGIGFLKDMAGWTSDLNFITSRLSPTQLRRLVAASPGIWSGVGPEDAWVNTIRLLTGARSRVWSWFDFRFILDETGTSEEHDGHDPWLINLPGFPALDENRSNLRVVDDGTGSLDRTLVLDILGLMRPAGERIETSWISFLDLFDDSALAQWGGTGSALVVAGGHASLSGAGAQSAYAVAPLASSWKNLCAFTRIRGAAAASGQRFGLALYAATDANRYRVGLDIVGNQVKVSKTVANVETILASVAPPAGPLFASVWYGLRIEIFPESGSNRIRVFLDSDLVVEVVDAALTAGTLGLWHDAGATMDCDEVEMFLLPLATDVVGPGA